MLIIFTTKKGNLNYWAIVFLYLIKKLLLKIFFDENGIIK